MIDISSGGKPANSDQGNLWLSLAEALRLSGHAEESRTAYLKASASSDAAVSQSARRRLEELSPAAAERGDKAAPAKARVSDTEHPVMKGPVPAGGAMTGSVPDISRHNPDALFGEGMRIVGGRDPKKLMKADLIRALEFFQYATQKGAHRGEASKYADLLGKELDRRNKK
jgi:hypothetical protein